MLLRAGIVARTVRGGLTLSELPDRIAVTGLGACTPAGVGVEALWLGVLNGGTNHHPVRHFDVDGVPEMKCGFVEDFEPAPGDSDMRRLLELARVSAVEAMDGSDGDEHDLVLGATCTGGSDFEAAYREFRCGASVPSAFVGLPTTTGAQLAEVLGWHGRGRTIASASASGGAAIGSALGLLRSGVGTGVLAGGADVVSAANFFGLHGFRTLHPDGCRPFAERRPGIRISEGSALLRLETPRGAMENGRRPLVWLLGYGDSNLARGMVRPDPLGIERAVRTALDDSGIVPDDVDYINAHGPGTRHGDRAEMAALSNVFGERLREIPISSSKSALGHCQAASGAVEAMVAALAVLHRCVPPTLDIDVVDPLWSEHELPVKPLWDTDIGVGLSLSCGLGGMNNAVVLGRAS